MRTSDKSTPTDAEIESGEEGDPELAVIHAGRRVPIYRKLGEFSSKRVREMMHATLAQLSDAAIPRPCLTDLRKRQKLTGRADALRHIHFPDETTPLALYEQARSPAHFRLIFEDFFWIALGIDLKRGKRMKETKGATSNSIERPS